MAYNPFIGWGREDLERELRSAQEDLAAGSSSIKATAGDVISEARVDKSPEARIKLLLLALNRLDPTTYPIADITPIDRTRVTFLGSDVLRLD